MNKNLPIIVSAIIGIILSFAIIFVLQNRSLVNSSLPSLVTNNQSQSADVVLATKNTTNEVTSLTLSPKKEKVISAFSIRFVIINNNVNTDSIAFTPNSDLLTTGWAFPINKVIVSDDQKYIFIDISGINTTPSGFNLNTDTTLGTFTGISSLTMAPDKGETKILAKDATELNYQFNP